MSTVASSSFSWVQECTYISDTTDVVLRGTAAARRAALKNFNGDKACFVRYCVMQKTNATRDGQYDSEQYIQHGPSEPDYVL